MGNIEVVTSALAAVRSGDLAAARAVVDDRFVWHIPGSSVISGDLTGAEAWAEKLQRLLAAGLQPQVIAMLDSETHVAAVQRNVATAGEHALDVAVVNLFTVDNGKVTRLDTFFGDQPAAEAFWNAALA